MDAAINDYRARREKRLAERGIYPEKISKIIAFAQRRAARLDARGYRADAEGDDQDNNQNEGGGGSSGGAHGNTRLPFGLCMRFGIEIDPSWGPREAWDALAGKGITPAGAYERLKKGEDPGTPDTPEPPKEPVKKLTPKGYEGSEYEELEGEKDRWAGRGRKPWELKGKRVGGDASSYWPPKTMRLRFMTKTDMFEYLKEQGIEEFADPETGEIINPKEMELPKKVGKYDGTGYTALTLGLRDGRYTITGTDYDGKKKKLDDFSTIAAAREFLTKSVGASMDDVKMSPALKKAEIERKSWLKSDKKEYIEEDGEKYGGLKAEKTYSDRWRLEGQSEDGWPMVKEFGTKAEMMDYLKNQGVKGVKIGEEKVDPTDYVVPETKAEIFGRKYSDIYFDVARDGDLTLFGTDLDGDTRTFGYKYTSEDLSDFKKRIADSYGISESQIDIRDKAKDKIAEIEKEEADREKRKAEFEAKAIDIPDRGKYLDVHIGKEEYGDRFALYGYDERGLKKAITSSGDMYDMDHYIKRFGLDVNTLLNDDDDAKAAWESYEKRKREFESKAIDFAGDKYSDIQIVYEKSAYGPGMYKVRGYDGRGRIKEIARETSYEDLEKVMNQYGHSPTQFPMDDEAIKRKDRAMKAKYALATGGYYALGKKDDAFKDIRVQQDPSGEWYIIGTDVDGKEKQVEIAKSWDDAISKMSRYGVSDYKLKDKSGAEMGKPTYGMHGVMLMRKPGGGFVVYADTDRFGTHEIMYESPKESEARKWLKDNNVPESGIKTKGMNPNDDVVREAHTKTMKNFDTHRMKAIEGTFIEDMSEEDKKDAADMMAELFNQGEYRVARSTDSFAGILENGYKSQIEMGKGGYGASKDKEGRKKCSNQMYGHGGLDKTEYEKMGYIAPPDIAEDYDTGDHPFYGGHSPMTYTLKKDTLKDRTTYTFGDSLNTYMHGSGSLKSAGYAGENPTIEGLTGIGGKTYMDRALRAYREYKKGDISFSEMFKRVRSLANNNYIELQFTGPVTASDIKKVSFDNVKYIKNAFSDMTPEQRKKTIKILKDNGIEVEYRKDRYSPFVDGWDWIKKNYPDDVA